PTPVEPPLPETLVNSVLSISFNTPDCLIVTIGTVCENQDTSVFTDRSRGACRFWHAEDFQRVAISQLATAQAMGERIFATNLAGAFLGKLDPR
ncbi:hypothetical protein ACEUDE_20705, partial [Aeromonas veronii]